ncbi:MAG: hypothetical protein IPN06_06635 [Burkholderiales bacterium]|nr:hypothetical protein [Burkholderiales bacterium]
MTHVALAASGCATVIDITAVNKPPMADIYRLDKRGIATGGVVAQMLTSFTPLGVFASAAADTTVEVAGSAIRRSATEAERAQELASQKWDDVFEVSYKPDYGGVIAIIIRESEIKRYSLEKNSRVVMFDPAHDIVFTTDDGKKVTRTRPSIEVPRSGLWTTKQVIPIPVTSELTEDYKKFCYAGQAGPNYRSMSGPWKFKEYKQPYLTNDEIDEVWQMINTLRSDLKDRSQGTDVERNQTAIDLQVIEVANSRLWKYRFTLNGRSEHDLIAHDKRIALQSQKLNDLKQSAGLDTSFGIDDWLGFVNKSIKAREQEYLAGNAKSSTN